MLVRDSILNIKELESWMIKCYNPQNDSFKETRRLLKEINKDNIIQILESIIEDSIYLKEIASKSYLHNNGFDKFSLIDNSNFKLRLHIWWPENKFNTAEDIHNHPWDFSSKVITGSLSFKNYEYDDSGENFYHYRISPPKEGEWLGYNNIELQGVKKLKCNFYGSIAGGSFYSQSKEVKHSVLRVDQSITSTLMLQGPLDEGISNIYKLSTFDNPKRIDIRFFTQEETYNKLKKYIDFLKMN